MGFPRRGSFDGRTPTQANQHRESPELERQDQVISEYGSQSPQAMEYEKQTLHDNDQVKETEPSSGYLPHRFSFRDTENGASALHSDTLELPEIDIQQQEDSQQKHIMESIRQLWAVVRQIPEEIQRGLSKGFGRRDPSTSKELDPEEVIKLQRKIISSEKKRLHMKKRIKVLVRAHQASEDKVREASTINQDLFTKLEAVQRERDAILQERDAVLQELKTRPKRETHGPLANSNKVSNAAIEDKWKQLAYNIRNLASFVGKTAPTCDISGSLEVELKRLSRDHVQLLQDDDCRELILEALVWSHVDRHILQAKRDLAVTIRGTNARCSLRSARNELLAHAWHDAEAMEKLGPWLSQGSQFIKRDLRAIRYVEHHIAERLTPFLNTGSERTSQPRLLEELNVITKAAFELDDILMGSKAIFLTHWRDERQERDMPNEYRDDIMDAVLYESALSETSIVKLITSPALIKIGNADGMNYDSRQVVVKTKVVCD